MPLIMPDWVFVSIEEYLIGKWYTVVTLLTTKYKAIFV